MRKFLKSVVAAVLVASMSVTGLATIASAKTTTSSSSARAVKTHSVTLHGITFKNVTLDWGSVLNLPARESYRRHDKNGELCVVPFTKEEEIIMRRALLREQSLDEYNKMNPYNKTTLTDDDVLAYFEYFCYSPEEAKYVVTYSNYYSIKSLTDAEIKNFQSESWWDDDWFVSKHLNGERHIYKYTHTFDFGKWFLNDFSQYGQLPNMIYENRLAITPVSYADVIYYARNIAGYTDVQVSKMYKARSKDYLTNSDSWNRYSAAIPSTKEEAKKYWDKNLWFQPCFATVVEPSIMSCRFSDLRYNMVYFDVLGRGFTKKDLLEGNLPSGGMFTLTDRAKAIFKSNPALEKLAILSLADELNRGNYYSGIFSLGYSCWVYDDSGKISGKYDILTNSEIEKLNTYFRFVTGKNYNTKLYKALDSKDTLARLYYAYNDLATVKRKSLDSYLKRLCRMTGLNTNWDAVYVDGWNHDVTCYRLNSNLALVTRNR